MASWNGAFLHAAYAFMTSIANPAARVKGKRRLRRELSRRPDVRCDVQIECMSTTCADETTFQLGAERVMASVELVCALFDA
jgi:hypothetical protein